MKTQYVICCLLILIISAFMTWQAESAWFAVMAYTTFIILLKGLGKKLIGKLDV